ncbi:MAG: glycosyltransferase family 4 protein [Chloroflexi bacterium]|nr:glycosyltransferase family 4 protein [Chloroflexota bacterium]
MQLKIGIDFTSASRERAGIGRYARELVRALSRLDRTNRYVLFVPRDAHNDLLRFDWPPNFSIVRARLTERYLAALWQRARVPLPVEVFIGAVDAFYSPDFLLPPTFARRKLVTVHDLSYVRVPECFPAPLLNYLNRAVPRSVARADLILADAASTQRDLADVYCAPREKIRVLYSGVDPRFRPDVADDARARVRELTRGKPYVLAVSTIQPRKNYARLIEAFARIANCELQIANSQFLFRNLQLVIAGGRGWMYEEIFETVERLNLRERVLFPEFVADDDLPALYADATLFAYPSLYEGFGLPVAEAMACGAPVVCSNASSLPEVAGDAALYFDPRDVDAIADALRRALVDEALRADLRARGFAQVKQFTWDKAARELRQYLEE